MLRARLFNMPKAKRKSFKGKQKQTREQTTNGVNENEMKSEQQSINTKDAMLAEMRQAGRQRGQYCAAV